MICLASQTLRRAIVLGFDEVEHFLFKKNPAGAGF